MRTPLKSVLLSLFIATASLLAFVGCSSDDEGQLQARLYIAIDGNCQGEGNVRVWVDGVSRFTLSAGEGKSLPADAGDHQIYAVSDKGRVWNKTFTVARLDSTLVLSCD